MSDRLPPAAGRTSSSEEAAAPEGSGFLVGVLGALLVLGGVLYFLHVMGWVSWTDVQPWELWPLVLVIIGFRAARHTSGLARVVSVAIVLVGLGLLALAFGFLDEPWRRIHDWLVRHDLDPRLLWALLLVLVGLFFLSGGRLVSRPKPVSGDRLRQLTIFGGFELKPVGIDFQGGWLAGIFGGFEVDLRGCTTTADVVRLDVIGIFGGGEIKVPAHWRVSIGGVPIFGGYSNETRHEPRAGEPSPHLIINAITLFGGFSVEN